MDSNQLNQERLIFFITLPLSTTIILTNLFIIMSIACNRQHHNKPNYFFLSLLVADLCTGFALPFFPRMGLNRYLHFRSCLFMHIFPNFLFLSFLFNLVMVHYVHYLCIVHPLHYSQFWVHRCFPVALLTVWIPPLLYASLPAFGWNNWKKTQVNINPVTNSSWDAHGIGQRNCSSGICDDFDDVCSYKQIFPKAFIYVEVFGLLFPAILSILFMTGRVLWIAHKQVRNICKLSRSVRALDHKHHLSLRYAKCVAAVTLVFLICWVPYIVYMHFSVAIIEKKSNSSSSVSIILSCTGIGSMAIIPIILSLINRKYTKPIQNLLIKIKDCCVGRQD